MVIRQVADTDCSILIFGESGSGKEVVARTIHHQSRRQGAFVAVNCGAIPATLLESELFGHERGAFTHATNTRIGRFEQADGGTLFLDEIAEMRPDLQVKLLRAIQERAFERVGGVHTVRVKVRILSATNQDLEKAMRAGRFRADLFYRLNVVSIHVPPLRARRSDIPELANHIINRLGRTRAYEIGGLSPATMKLLQDYDWPGNVRELENLIERAMVLKRRGALEVEDFPAYLEDTSRPQLDQKPHAPQAACWLSARPSEVPAHKGVVEPTASDLLTTEGQPRCSAGSSDDVLSGHARTRFFQLNMPAVNACLRGARRQSAAVLCLALVCGLFPLAAWGAPSRLESRAELQAAHWLERALPDSGGGLESFRRGITAFEAQQFQEAVESFTEASRLGAGSPVEEAAVFLAAESRARAATKPQEIRTAIIALEEARRRYAKSPKAGWALWRLGSLHRQLGLDHEALARYEQFVRQEPSTNPLMPFVRLDLADVYIVQGRYAAAAKSLRYVRQFPPDPESLGLATVALGDMSHALGQYRQARELYEIAEDQWPDMVRSRPVSLFGMGDTLLRLRDWPRALQLLDTGYALYPRDPLSSSMLVRIADGLKLSGQIQQAKGLYRTVIERHQGTEGELLALIGWGEIAEGEALAGANESDVQSAYGAIATRWKDKPAAADALFRLGQSYQRGGQIELAALSYDELLQRTDSRPWRAAGRKALEMILRSLSASGKTIEVANLYFRHETLLNAPMVDGPTGLVVAGALARLELIDPAIELIQASLAAGITPVQHEYALVALADAYRKNGDQAKLESVWQQYLRRYPQGAWASEAREGLIMALSRTGKLKEGEKACHIHLSEREKAGSEISLDARLACADIFVSMGQPSAGEPLYRELLKIDNDDEDSVWAAYQVARVLQTKRPSDAAEFFGRATKAGKDSLLAAAAAAQLGPVELGERR